MAVRSETNSVCSNARISSQSSGLIRLQGGRVFGCRKVHHHGKSEVGAANYVFGGYFRTTGDLIVDIPTLHLLTSGSPLAAPLEKFK